MVFSVTVVLTLLGSAVMHFCRPDGLRRALAVRLDSRARSEVVTLLSASVIFVEAASATTIAFGLISGLSAPVYVGLVIAGMLFAAYSFWSWSLYRVDSETPCGCVGSDLPTNSGTVSRALLLSAAAFCSLPGVGATPTSGFGDWLVCMLCSIAIALLLWALPEAFVRLRHIIPFDLRSPRVDPTSAPIPQTYKQSIQTLR